MPRRIGGVRRLPQSFEAIPLSERLAWSRGQPRIEAEPQPGTWGIVWPSWAAWGEAYSKCRGAFLGQRAERNLPTTGSERLRAALLVGRDPEEVSAELRREEMADDPRLKMGWGGPGHERSE